MTMAVDVCSENDAGISPRISFSHDLNEGDVVPIEIYPCRQDASLLDSSSSFEFPFYVSGNSSGKANTQEASTADELFADGKILPMNTIIKKPATDAKALESEKDLDLDSDPTLENTGLKSTSLKECLGYGCELRKQKSPWKFTRSFSLNCYGSSSTSKAFGSLMKLSRSFSMGEKTSQDVKPTKGIIGSMRSLLGSNPACGSNQDDKPVEETRLFKFFTRSASFDCENRGFNGPLNFLSRSYSTGSEPNPRLTGSKKRYQKLQWEKGSHGARAKSCLPKSSTTKDLLTRRRQGKKMYGADYKAGVRPLLNLPPPCVSGINFDLFGWSSLLCNGNGDKKNRK